MKTVRQIAARVSMGVGTGVMEFWDFKHWRFVLRISSAPRLAARVSRAGCGWRTSESKLPCVKVAFYLSACDECLDASLEATSLKPPASDRATRIEKNKLMHLVYTQWAWL